MYAEKKRHAVFPASEESSARDKRVFFSGAAHGNASFSHEANVARSARTSRETNFV